MEELVGVLNDIKFELQEMNSKLSEIKGSGFHDSISDINDKIDEIKGEGLYDSISDVNQKLDTISTAVESIDLNTM